MATYTASQLGITAPKEGFKDLGWYNGRQYVGGSFGEANQIHPNSPQQGAGQQVSSEVRAQSAAAQGKSTQEFDSYLKTQGAPITQTTIANAANTSLPTGAGAGAGMGMGVQNPTVPNLPEMYKSLYEQAGISALEADLTEKEKAYIEAKGKTNDNPFLSEGTRVGRIAKLETLYNERTMAQRNEIAQKKADIDMQMNLATKQFDINSQAAQQALQQFGVLLDSGALNNASGEDIANLTRMTGLSSSMIQNAVQAQKIKGYQSSVQTFDDGVNEGFVVYTIDQYGNIVNSQREVTGKSSKAVDSSSKNVFNGLIPGSSSNSDWEIVGSLGTQQPGISSLWGKN